VPEPPADHPEERAFAEAVARADPAAVARFEQEYLGPLGRVLASMKLDASTLDEVRQGVRERLLVPTAEGTVRLVAYAGQGRLAGLVQVTASRIALDLVRARTRDTQGRDDDALAWLTAHDPDPALVALKRLASQHFREAFARAVEGLDPRERNVLTLHLRQGVTLEKLAEMYGVHRATVVRWLAGARASILSRTRRELATRMHVELGEVDGIIALLESRLDASVERLFASQE